VFKLIAGPAHIYTCYREGRRMLLRLLQWVAGLYAIVAACVMIFFLKQEMWGLEAWLELGMLCFVMWGLFISKSVTSFVAQQQIQGHSKY
jgi:carbon starvation protein CstA